LPKIKQNNHIYIYEDKIIFFSDTDFIRIMQYE